MSGERYHRGSTAARPCDLTTWIIERDGEEVAVIDGTGYARHYIDTCRRHGPSGKYTMRRAGA